MVGATYCQLGKVFRSIARGHSVDSGVEGKKFTRSLAHPGVKAKFTRAWYFFYNFVNEA